MGYRLTKITTRTGDDGKTNLGTKQRLSKDHSRIEAIGTIDELNSCIGVVIAQPFKNTEITDFLLNVQQDLFNLGGELCPPYRPAITINKIHELEKCIDAWNKQLPPLTEFVLPGGNLAAAHCHVARTVCRRAERCLVKLHIKEKLRAEILQYINRLSDLLFVAARLLARETSTTEILWEHSPKSTTPP